MRLPTLESCNQDDPEERFQWLLVGLPGFGSSPFLVPDYLSKPWSKHFSDAGMVHAPTLAKLANEDGFIHVSQLPEQKVRMRPPYRGQQHSLNGAVSWVPIDDPDPEPVQIPDPAQFTEHERALMVERLRFTGDIPEADPVHADDVAEASGPLFDPTKNTPSNVNTYLSAPIPLKEKRRVYAAEMAGKARPEILNKHRGL